MKIRGPLVTLAAVAALGVGMLLVNMSKEAPPANPYSQSTTTAAAATPAVPPPRAQHATAIARVRRRPITSARSRPPAARSHWRSRSRATRRSPHATTTSLSSRGCGVAAVNRRAEPLASKDKASRLEGHLEGDTVVGTLWIGEKKWDFNAPAGQPPAGLYVYENAGVRNSWIVDPNGGVTGVQRREDGSTAPAPRLTTDGIANIDGIEVKAIRVQGASGV